MTDPELAARVRVDGLRVLVCGGRNYADLGAVWGQLDAHHALQGPIAVVIHGGARGADLLAEKWAVANNVRYAKFKPDWDQFGPAAGPIRNKRMLDEGLPDLVIAFPGGRGTADMVWQAKDRGVTVQLANYLRSEALIRTIHAREYRHQSESEERPAEARALRKFAVLDAAKAAWFEMWANWIGRDV